jgi:hypothetical protein
MTNSISELEKELQQAEKRYRELAQLVEAAQENSEVLERVISYLDEELSNQSDDGKRFIVNQVITHLKKYLSPTPEKVLDFNGVVMLQERFGAKKDADGYTYFCGIDYRRVKGDNQNSTSVWRNYLLSEYPSEGTIEIVDNLKDSPVKGRYLLVGWNATLKDVATIAVMNFEVPPVAGGQFVPLNIDENLIPIVDTKVQPQESVLDKETLELAPQDDAESPHLLIGKTITTSAYGSAMVGKVTGYVDGDEKPWRVKADDIPVELFLVRSDFELL